MNEMKLYSLPKKYAKTANLKLLMFKTAKTAKTDLKLI